MSVNVFKDNKLHQIAGNSNGGINPDEVVTSVNGKTGDVELSAEDVGALPEDGKAKSASAADSAVKATNDKNGNDITKTYGLLSDTQILLQQQQGIYKGRDLTVVFADEIKNYSNEWAWIKARIKANNFNGIYICDYIPLTVDGETHQMQVAGIDTYYRTTDQGLGHHIDFISRDCYSQTVQWNTTNNNNGNTTSEYPYMVSNLKTFLGTLYEKLPQAVKNVITEKRTLLEKRYSASGALTDSTGLGWDNMGKLWVPTEYEVFDSVVWGTPRWSAGQTVQYPLFANSYKNRIKGSGSDGGRCNWWLASVRSGGSAAACHVSDYGGAGGYDTSNASRAPLCFRITAD